MAKSINRQVMGPQAPVARNFADKSAAAKIAQGWGETIKDLPSEAVDKLERTVAAIAHPVDTVKRGWAELKEDPKHILLPIAMMAGGAALTAISPGLMRAVGIGMTASVVVIPTVKFAKSRSEDELEQIADGASKQIVSTAASYATSWAAGKVVRASLAKFQAKKAGPAVGAEGVQARGDVRLKGSTPAEMRSTAAGHEVSAAKAGGLPDPDSVNYAGFRTNKEMGHEFVTEVRAKVKAYHVENLKAQNPGASVEDIEAFLKTPEARPLRLQMVQDVRGVVHSQNLQMHGVQVPDDIAIQELAHTRKYMQDISSTYDMADAVKGINKGLAAGERTAAQLGVSAERALYTERGVTAPNLSKLEKLGMTAEQLKKTRVFADRFATSQGGKYLNTAASSATAADVDALRGTITRQLATDAGYVVPPGAKVDDRTLLSLFRDLGEEEPKNAKQIVSTVNEALKKGETKYYKLNEIANRKTLSNLGVDEAAQKALDLSDDALKAAQPDYPVELTRAEQVRLLRDRLRALPAAQRTEAVTALQAGKGNLLNFDEVLAPHFDAQLQKVTGASTALVERMTQGMTAQQKANFVTDLNRLDPSVRSAAFANLSGDVEAMNKTVVDRLTGSIADKFKVTVHRDAGKFPIEGWGDDSFVQDWSVQGATQLHNGLGRMATNGKLPTDLQGTTYVSMNGQDPSPAGVGMVPWTMPGKPGKPLLYYRPGSGAYQGGTMGYRTGTQDGRDLIVLFDDAMKMANADEVAGVTLAEGTLIHESGHAIQLGGKVGASQMDRMLTEQKLVKEWSSLSDWREPDGTLADGYRMVGGKPGRYYKDPAVSVGARNLVVSDYGATDSVEDFAEFTRIFYNDPAQAMAVSPEKFLYMNQMYENHYSADQTTAMAQTIGLGADGLTKALGNMRGKIAGVPGNALGSQNVFQKLKSLFGSKAS